METPSISPEGTNRIHDRKKKRRHTKNNPPTIEKSTLYESTGHNGRGFEEYKRN